MTGVAEVHLTTERLLLRPQRDDDAAALFTVFADREVTRYWSTPPWPSIEHAQRLIARENEAMAAGKSIRLAITRRGDPALIGTCTLFAWVPGCRRAEVGYALARPVWGQGFMHEALTALLDHGFTAMDLHRVEADIDPRNTASARSLERLGFTREGLLRERWIVDGEVSDSAMYGLLRPDWMARRAAPNTPLEAL